MPKRFSKTLFTYLFFIYNLFKFQPLLFDFTPNIYIAHHYVIYICIYMYIYIFRSNRYRSYSFDVKTWKTNLQWVPSRCDII